MTAAPGRLCLLVLLLSALANVAVAQRYTGDAALVRAADSSSDGRFSLRGRLHADPAAAQLAGSKPERFKLQARLISDTRHKAATLSCAASDFLFSNGFEGVVTQ